MRGKERRKSYQNNHKTRKILVVEREDPVLTKQTVGSSFNSALPLRSVKAAKDGCGVRRWGQSTKTENRLNSSARAGRTRREGSTRGVKWKWNSPSRGVGAHPSKVTLLSGENKGKNRRDDKLQRANL